MKLTIVTVTKNNYGELEETLKSVYKLRDSKECEQIVVDGSLTQVAKKNQILCKSLGVKYIYQKPKGIASAFNLGLNEAKGTWVWYLNAGDKLIDDFREDYLWWLLANSDADMISFQVIMSKRGKTSPTPLRKLWPVLVNWVNHQGAFTRRLALLELGGFDVSFKIAADGELWLRFFASNRSADIISVPIVKFADGGASARVANTALEVVRAYGKNWKKIILGMFYPMGRTIRVIFGYLVKTTGPTT